ncbi:Hypothetical secreted protein [Clostridium acetobutylicum EA 2018]|uniref:hypothetical protein n=1 Tax=Clostridium acetobutylicum TaxID=1488 RepID=UPI000200C32A|nr:hypothetical protein [Clostridium acetobutylicum]ADZ21675.1 Hypothetical secreted protein [Clostridium acetobutylicum EA 2018]
MKKLRNVIICVLISIIIQSGLLYYMNAYMFKNITKVTYRIIKTEEKKKVLSISIPQDADKIQVSSTGKYVSYISNNALHVVQMSNGVDKKVQIDCDLSDVYAKWRVSEDVLVVIEKVDSGIKVYKCDPLTGEKQQALDFNNKGRTYDLTRSSSNVVQLQSNDLNTIMYIKEQTGSGASYIDKLDISEGITKMPLGITKVGDYYVFKAEDKVVLEDLADNKIMMATSDNSQTIEIPGVNNPKLLYVDGQGNLYVANVVNDKIVEIYTASLNNRANNSSSGQDSNFKASWNKITLKEPADPKYVYISDLGDIYAVDHLKGKAINIKNNKSVSFNNMYVTMYGDSEKGGIISRDVDNNKLIETPIK